MLKSKATIVTIQVKPRCVDGIRVPSGKKILSIKQGDAPKRVLPEAEVFVCGGSSSCKVKSAELELKMQETAENRQDFALSKLAECGLNAETISLIPKKEEDKNLTKIKDEDDDEFEEDGDDWTSEENTHLFEDESTAV